MNRAFSRNLGDQEELLIKESVTYASEDGFESQTQTHMRSQEVTLANQKVLSQNCFPGKTKKSGERRPLQFRRTRLIRF